MVLHKQQTAGETFTANVRGVPMSRETPSCYIIPSHINPSSSLLLLLFFTLPAANLLFLPLSLLPFFTLRKIQTAAFHMSRPHACQSKPFAS